MKLEMLIEGMLPLSCYRKKTRKFFPTSTVTSIYVRFDSS